MAPAVEIVVKKDTLLENVLNQKKVVMDAEIVANLDILLENVQILENLKEPVEPVTRRVIFLKTVLRMKVLLGLVNEIM